MVEFFKTVDGRITEVREFTEGCWVNMVHPSSDELEQIAQAAQVEEEFVRAALDPEESSRVDTEDEQLLMIVDIPMVEKSSVEDGGQMFTTIPMGIVVAQNAVITVCLEDSIILRSHCRGASNPRIALLCRIWDDGRVRSHVGIIPRRCDGSTRFSGDITQSCDVAHVVRTRLPMHPCDRRSGKNVVELVQPHSKEWWGNFVVSFHEIFCVRNHSKPARRAICGHAPQ